MSNLYNSDNNSSFNSRAEVVASLQNHSITILRLPEVVKRVGLCRASIYQRMADGTFPTQVSLGVRAVGWIEHEIDKWLGDCIAARRREGVINWTNIKAGLVISVGMFLGSWFGAKIALSLPDYMLKRVFCLFLLIVAVRMWIQTMPNTK